MDITSMLTISISHISKETEELLRSDPPNFPPIFTKRDSRGDYGYFIHVDNEFLYEDDTGVKEMYPDTSDDLHYALLKAYEHNCNWLCLDRDGDIVDELSVYEW